MARYDQWRRLSGDTDEPALFDFGKKLLGEVAEQRRLSGVETLTMVRKLPDGSVIRAGFQGGHPFIDVAAGGEKKPGIIEAVIQGLVTAPRTFASPTAFAAHPEAMLDNHGVPLDIDGNQPWASLLYSRYKTVYKAGLDKCGTVDWRNADESISVNWGRRRSRYWGGNVSDGGMGDPGAGAVASCVYHNGAVIFDAYDLAGAHFGRWIAGACMKGSKLFVMVLELRAGGYFFRLVKASAKPDPKVGPQNVRYPARYKKCSAASMTVLAEQAHPVSVSVAFFPAFNFNQACTEARSIDVRFDGGFTFLKVIETVFNFADLDDITAVNNTLATNITVTSTTTITYPEVRPNAFYRETARLEYPPGAPIGTWSGLAPVTWVGTETKEREVTRFGAGSPAYYDLLWADANQRDFLPLAGVYTQTTVCSHTEYPCAVDYIDNVPVYAHFRIGLDRSFVASRACTVAQGEATFIEGEISQQGFGDPFFPGSYLEEWGFQNSTRERTSASTRGTDVSVADARAGLYCPNLAPLTGNWLDLSGSIGSTSNVTAVGEGRMYVETFYAYDSRVPSETTDTNFDYTYDASYDRTYDRIGVTHSILFLDLRYKAAAVETYTETVAETINIVRTGEFVPPDDTLPLLDIIQTTTGQQTTTYDYQTRVIFHGVEIDSWAGYKPTLVEPYDAGPDTLYQMSIDHDNELARYSWWPLVARDAFQKDPAWPGYRDEELINSLIYPLLAPGGLLDPIPAEDFDTTLITDSLAGDDYAPTPSTGAGADYMSPGYVFVNITMALVDNTFYAGTWIAYRRGWMFSMPYRTGNVDTAATWRNRINDGDKTLDELTGDYTGVQLYSRAWPLCRATFFATRT